MTTDRPPAAGAGHRWLSVFAVATIVVVGVAAAMVHRSLTGELLVAGTGSGAFPGQPVEDPPEERPLVAVDYHHHAEYRFEFTVTNQSRWPVRIVDFPGLDGLLRQVDVAVDRTPFQAAAPFDPSRPLVSLNAGEEAIIRVRARFANCEHHSPGTQSTLSAVPVGYRALWATRTQLVELPTAIQVAAPPETECPGG